MYELRQHSDIRPIDRALAAMNAELAIEPPDFAGSSRAA
jgi:hypothetical protein